MTAVSQTAGRPTHVDPSDAAHRAPSVEFATGDRLTFPDGMVGCPDWREFVVRVDQANAPILELECVSRPGIVLMAVAPELVFNDYRVPVAAADRESIDLQAGDKPVLLALIVLRDAAPRATVNLAGPLVINSRTKLGRQLVLDGERYPLRHPISE